MAASRSAVDGEPADDAVGDVVVVGRLDDGVGDHGGQSHRHGGSGPRVEGDVVQVDVVAGVGLADARSERQDGRHLRGVRGCGRRRSRGRSRRGGRHRGGGSRRRCRTGRRRARRATPPARPRARGRWPGRGSRGRPGRRAGRRGWSACRRRSHTAGRTGTRCGARTWRCWRRPRPRRRYRRCGRCRRRSRCPCRRRCVTMLDAHTACASSWRSPMRQSVAGGLAGAASRGPRTGTGPPMSTHTTPASVSAVR